MTLFKTALANLKKNKITSLLLVIEMTAAVFTAAVMISSILIKYSYYEPFKDLFQSKGFMSNMWIIETTSNGDNMIHGDMIAKYIGNPPKMIATSRVQIFGLPEGEIALSYNDELLKRYSPKLKCGRWLNTSEKAEKIEVVVSDNPYGWKTGDTVTFDFYGDGTAPVEAEIVGEIENGSKIFGLPGNLSHGVREKSEDNFELCYEPFDYEYEEQTLLLFSTAYLDSAENPAASAKIIQICQGTHFFVYDESTSAETIERDKQRLSDLAGIHGANHFDLDMLERNNRQYLRSEAYDMLPIIIVILILTFAGSISGSALSARERLRDYSVFCICGLRWRQCAAVNLIQSAMIAAAGLALAFAAMLGAPLVKTVTIVWNWRLPAAALGVTALFMAVSMIMPLLIIGKSTLKQVLMNRE